MAKSKNDKTIFWIIGIVILLLVVTKLPLPGFPFAVITKTTCADKTLSYWDLDGNVLDSNNLNNGINNGVLFVPGRIGQAVGFNTNTSIDFPVISSTGKTIVMWIKNYSTGSDWYFASETNGTDGVNKIIPIGAGFGLGFNGSVDEIAVFSPALTPEELSNFSAGIKVCYTTSYEENITCKDYATEQVTDTGEGCLNYSGDLFPNCEYEWINISQYRIVNNTCEKYFYCQENPEYASEQTCIEDLVYDCYVLENNKCISRTDYGNCTGTDSYADLTECQADLTTVTPTNGSTLSIGTTPPKKTFIDKLNEEVFTIAGFGVKLIYLIIALVIFIALMYFMKDEK